MAFAAAPSEKPPDDFIAVELIDPLLHSCACPICYVSFESGGERTTLPHQSLVLPCGHSICRSCTSALEEHAASRFRIVCPLCKAIHSAEKKANGQLPFPRNFALEATAEIVERALARLLGRPSDGSEGEEEEENLGAATSSSFAADDTAPPLPRTRSAAMVIVSQPQARAMPRITDRAVLLAIVNMLEEAKKPLTLPSVAEKLESLKAWPPAGFLKRAIEAQRERGSGALQAELLRKPTPRVLRAFIESSGDAGIGSLKKIVIQRQALNLTPVITFASGFALSVPSAAVRASTAGASVSGSTANPPPVFSRVLGTGHAFGSVSAYAAFLSEREQDAASTTPGEAAAAAALQAGGGKGSSSGSKKKPKIPGVHDDEDARYFEGDGYDDDSYAGGGGGGGGGKKKKNKKGGGGAAGYDDFEGAW